MDIFDYSEPSNEGECKDFLNPFFASNLDNVSNSMENFEEEKHHISSYGQRSNSCILSIIQTISDAQKLIKENKCKTSWGKAIEDLRGLSTTRLDTVPFILYCKQNLSPYKAYGINKTPQGEFTSVESFVFRVHDVDEDGCAEIELLTTCLIHKPPLQPYFQLNDETVKSLKGSGICIKIDLTCYCAITCLPAIELT